MHQVKLEWKKDLVFEAIQPDGTKVMLDSSPEFGGKGKGSWPKPLMLTSLAGCTAMDVAALMQKMRLDVNEFRVEVSAGLTKEHPKYYNKVKVEYHFYGEHLNREKLQKCVQLSEEKYCGVLFMFRKFAEVTSEIYYHE